MFSLKNRPPATFSEKPLVNHWLLNPNRHCNYRQCSAQVWIEEAWACSPRTRFRPPACLDMNSRQLRRREPVTFTTRPLSWLRHHRPKDVINTRAIARTVLLKPFEDVGIQTHGYQFLWRTPELTELLLGERRNIGIIDLRGILALLPPCSGVQDCLPAFIEGRVPDRFGAPLDLLPGPR
jgi:hypothetical protein